MSRTLLAVTASAALVLVAGLATAQHHGHHSGPGHAPSKADTRQLVKFPPELAEHTLANMRDHLLALEEITSALSKGQADVAGKVAEHRLGMSSLPLHGAHEVAKFMPKGMQDAGTSMHRAASRFSVEVQNSAVTGDMKPALGALAEVMSACNGCHAGYRLR